MQAKQTKESLCCFSLACRCSATPRRAGPVTWNGSLGRQRPLLHMYPFLLLSASFIADHDSTWHGTSPWSDWASCPGCDPSPAPGVPPAFSLALCKHRSATAETLVYYQWYFHHKSHRQHQMSLYEESYLYPSQHQYS